MPARVSTGRVRCPQCGARFRLEDQVVDQLHTDWQRAEGRRLEKELLAKLRPRIEETARRLDQRRHRDELNGLYEELRGVKNENRGLRRRVNELSRKVPPERAQALGGVRQEMLEESLRAGFPDDEINPVARARAGADIIQIVRDRKGRQCGSILWEAKRTRNWSNKWIDKLRKDQRAGNHTIGVIVTDVQPPGHEATLSELGGVWLCSPVVASELCRVLRSWLICVAEARGARARRDDLKGCAYDYLTGPAFVQHLGGVLEAALRMRSCLDEERRTYEAKWVEREHQIRDVVAEAAEIYGDLKGLGMNPVATDNLELEVPSVTIAASAESA